jgi:ribose transport system permease protein
LHSGQSLGDDAIESLLNRLKAFRQFLTLLLAAGVLLGLFRLKVPMFLSPANLMDLAQQVSINAILAFGMTLVILIGGIDLSVGALLALTGTVAAYCMVGADSGLGLGVMPAVLIGLATAAAAGFCNGVCASRTAMPAFIITLATMQIERGAALRFNEGRPLAIPEQYELFLKLGNYRIGDVLPVPVLVMLGLFVLAATLLHRTRFGQHVYAIGGNREAARFTGIPITRVETLVYVVCSVFAGVAGLINTAQLYSAEPASGVGFELNAIAAAVVGGTSFTGGRGTMYGTLLGAVIIGILDKGLNQAGVHFSFQYIIKGAVILGAVYLDVRRRK